MFIKSQIKSATLTTSLLLATLCLLNIVQGSTTLGKCPEVQLRSTLDTALYKGRWYEVQRGDLFQEDDQICVTADYTLQYDRSLRIKNRARYPDGSFGGIMGRVVCRQAECRAKFDQFFIPAGKYMVLDTDYNTYAIVYTCAQYLFGVFKQENVWVLSRSTTAFDATTQTNILNTIQTRIPNYDITKLKTTPQGGTCVYDQEPLQPVSP
eukprot:403377127